MNEALSLQPLSARDFNNFRRLAYDYCGLNIENGKEELVASRLGKIMRRMGITSFSKYYDHVVSDKSLQTLIEMIDHLTTNHTSFFREPQHFNFLKTEIFPSLSRRSHLEIWSAACSSGEEPYSLAFSAREYFSQQGPIIQILATDISTRILDVARRGVYEKARLQGIEEEMQKQYFLKGSGEMQGLYQVKPEVQQITRFERLNLMEQFPDFIGRYPLICCRNAMIYFDAPTRQKLVARFFCHLEPGGYLFIGHSESLNGIDHDFEYVRPATYRRPGTLSMTANALARST